MSLFHIKAATPQSLRDEVVAYLRDRADILRRQAAVATSQRDMAAKEACCAELDRAADFWREINIDNS